MLTKETLIREYRAARSSWVSVAVVYGMIIGAMVMSGFAIV